MTRLTKTNVTPRRAFKSRCSRVTQTNTQQDTSSTIVVVFFFQRKRGQWKRKGGKVNQPGVIDSTRKIIIPECIFLFCFVCSLRKEKSTWKEERRRWRLWHNDGAKGNNNNNKKTVGKSKEKRRFSKQIRETQTTGKTSERIVYCAGNIHPKMRNGLLLS